MKRTPSSSVRALAFLSSILAGLCAFDAASAATASSPAVSPASLHDFQSDADDGSLFPAIRAQLRTADAAARKTLEAQLLAVAADSGATHAGREAACFVLAGFASEAALKPLTPLLKDAKLTHAARAVLETLPGAAVDRVFLAALNESEGDTKLGIIDTLAVRRTAKAVAPLAALAGSADPKEAAAAVYALGAIGDLAALNALEKIDKTGPLASARAHALLLASKHLIASGQATKPVLNTLENLQAEGQPEAVRAAAWRQSIEAQPKQAADLVSGLFASGESGLRRVAAQALDLVPDETSRSALTVKAKDWSIESQALLVENLSSRGSPVVLGMARGFLSTEDPALKLTAIRALGRLGDSGDLPSLLGFLEGEGETHDAARAAIQALADPKVNELLVDEFSRTDSPLRSAIPELLAERSYRAAIPVLLAAGSTADRAVASEIYKAIGVLGDEETVAQLVEQLDASDGSARSAIERCIVAIGRRLADGAVSGLLGPRIGSPDVSANSSSFTRMIGAIGDARALEFLTPLITADTPDDVAMRAVFAWKSADAIPVLESLIVRTELPEATRQSAWRSLLRISGDNFRESNELALRGFHTCMMAAPQKEDRAQVAEALGRFGSPQAVSMLRSWLLIPGASAAADKALQAIEERKRNSGRAL